MITAIVGLMDKMSLKPQPALIFKQADLSARMRITSLCLFHQRDIMMVYVVQSDRQWNRFAIVAMEVMSLRVLIVPMFVVYVLVSVYDIVDRNWRSKEEKIVQKNKRSQRKVTRRWRSEWRIWRRTRWISSQTPCCPKPTGPVRPYKPSESPFKV